MRGPPRTLKQGPQPTAAPTSTVHAKPHMCMVFTRKVLFASSGPSQTTNVHCTTTWGRHRPMPERETTMTNHPLLDLHPELQLYIVDRLERFRDLAALTLTCKALHHDLSPVLYRIAYRIEPDLLPWLCSQGGVYSARALQRLLDVGADPARLNSRTVARASSGLHREYAKLDTCRGFESDRNSRKWISRGELQPPSNAPWNWYKDELGRRHPGQMDHDSSQGLNSILAGFSEPGSFMVQWSAIHVAVLKGHTEILDVLLDHDSNNGNKLIDSLVAGYCKIDETLPARMRERHRLPDDDREVLTQKSQLPQSRLRTLHSPLRAALCNRQQDAARLLITRGAKLEFAGPDGETEHALHVAARYGCLKIIKSLSLQPGIDLDVQDHTGWTPLCEAIVSRHTSDTVTHLIDLGADVNTSLGPDGFTHLHLACYRRQWAHALALLEAGADVEAIWTAPVTGSVRAIDLICTDTFDPGQRYFDIPKESTNAPVRLDLLTRLIRDYKASTAPCPGATISPLAIAATRSRVSLDLVAAFVRAQVYFHTDHSIVSLVLSTPISERHQGEDYTDGNVIAVARYLVRHGARVGRSPGESEVLARAVHRLLIYIRGPRREGMLRKFGRFLEQLVKRAGMDPDLPAMRADGASVDGERSLYRAALCDTRFEYNLVISSALWSAGATPPGVLEFLRDWCEIIPGLDKFEVLGYDEWRKKGFPEGDEWMDTDDEGEAPALAKGKGAGRGARVSAAGASLDNRVGVVDDEMEDDVDAGGENEDGDEDENEEDEGEDGVEEGGYEDFGSDVYTDDDPDDFVDDELEDEDSDDADPPTGAPEVTQQYQVSERELEDMRAMLLRTLLYIGPDRIGHEPLSPEDVYQGLFKDLTITEGSEIASKTCGIFMEADELERWRREASEFTSALLRSMATGRKAAWSYDGAEKILEYCRRIRAGMVGLGAISSVIEEEGATLTRR